MEAAKGAIAGDPDAWNCKQYCGLWGSCTSCSVQFSRIKSFDLDVPSDASFRVMQFLNIWTACLLRYRQLIHCFLLCPWSEQWEGYTRLLYLNVFSYYFSWPTEKRHCIFWMIRLNLSYWQILWMLCGRTLLYWLLCMPTLLQQLGLRRHSFWNTEADWIS